MADINLIKAVTKGMLTFIPGVTYLLNKKKRATRHSGAHAEFCYSLWLSLLVFLEENDIHPDLKKIGEIGSGGSIGVGICALLCGCENYYALEIDGIFEKNQNLEILDELILLFRNKTRISDKFSQLNIKISNYEYPQNIIKPVFLEDNVISEIRTDIINGFSNSKRIQIVNCWETHTALNLDFVFSRAVMEHVSEPESVYKSTFYHLKPGSLMFHDIEFHSHGITKNVNGYYLLPEYLWKIIFGRRSYFLNRLQIADHRKVIISLNFEIISLKQNYIKGSESSEKILFGAIILAKKRNE